MAEKEFSNDVSYVIEKHLGMINKYASGWVKEVNLVSWNGKPAKIDIREWDASHTHMSRGITLHRNEIEGLVRILWGYLGEEERKELAAAAAQMSPPPAAPSSPRQPSQDTGKASNGNDMAEEMRIEPETGEVLSDKPLADEGENKEEKDDGDFGFDAETDI
ncbi:MAG: hypothetical protein HFE73_01310 [Firmicutes bacterium]|nr:hypothetical protein [Bacillota bacterium]